MQAALNALALSETVYRIMDPGGLPEAERVAHELCRELPAFARSPLRLQWSSNRVPQRYLRPALAQQCPCLMFSCSILLHP